MSTTQDKNEGVAASQPLTHTPLPWQDRAGFLCTTDEEATIVAGIPRWHKKQTRINDLPFAGFQNGYYWPSKEEIAANAAFIVLACNSHYELLGACDRTPNPSGSGTMSNYHILLLAISALRGEGHYTLATELEAIQEHQRAAIQKATQP